jgi:hypothetical protein
MKHSLETYSPGILPGGFIYQDRNTAVDIGGKGGIDTGAENRTGFGVGIQPQKILPTQTENPEFVLQMFHPSQEKPETGLLLSPVAALKGQQAELVTAVDILENLLTVLEIK